MPDQRTTRNQLVTEGSAQYTVIAVSFEDHAKAYEALSTLKELDAQRRVIGSVGE